PAPAKEVSVLPSRVELPAPAAQPPQKAPMPPACPAPRVPEPALPAAARTPADVKPAAPVAPPPASRPPAAPVQSPPSPPAARPVRRGSHCLFHGVVRGDRWHRPRGARAVSVDRKRRYRRRLGSALLHELRHLLRRSHAGLPEGSPMAHLGLRADANRRRGHG